MSLESSRVLWKKNMNDLQDIFNSLAAYDFIEHAQLYADAHDDVSSLLGESDSEVSLLFVELEDEYETHV